MCLKHFHLHIVECDTSIHSDSGHINALHDFDSIHIYQGNTQVLRQFNSRLNDREYALVYGMSSSLHKVILEQ